MVYAAPAPGYWCVALAPAPLSALCEPSEHVDSLAAGDQLRVLEQRCDEQGQVRVRSAHGWATLAGRDGKARFQRRLSYGGTTLEMVRLGDVDRAGIRFGLHSDMPMAPGSPLDLMHAAVNRINFANEVAGPNQRVSPMAALRGVTLDAAFIMGLEDDYGSISEGKLANFTILSENPLTVNPERIKDINVISTILEGKHYPIN